MPSTPDFNERLRKISVRNRKTKHEKHKPWPIDKKVEVVAQYLVLGNMKQVAALTGVDHSLIRTWKGQPWWAELEAEIRQTQNIEMDSKLSKIVDRSLDAVLDRVENGDFFYDQKTGVIKRKPANLRDVAKVSTDIISKRELLRGNATERKETTQISVNEQLKLLATEFAKWNSGKKSDIPLVEVVDVESREIEEEDDAFYEERETRLQEGSSKLHQSSGSEEEASGAECSSSGNGESREGS
jgi:G:T/U-mismatch repair DNA glycosylase